MHESVRNVKIAYSQDFSFIMSCLLFPKMFRILANTFLFNLVMEKATMKTPMEKVISAPRTPPGMKPIMPPIKHTYNNRIFANSMAMNITKSMRKFGGMLK